MSAAAYRARSATELIDATFQLLRRNAAAFFTLSAMFSIPNAILAAIFVPTSMIRPTAAAVNASSAFGGILIYFIALMALGSILYSAMTIASGDAYLGRPVVAADALQRAVPKSVTVFIGYIASTILIFLGMLGFIIGGLIVALMLFAVVQVIVFENADVPKALSRSSTLSKGLKGHIFLTFLLAFVIIWVASIIIYFVGLAAGSVWSVLQLVVQALLNTLLIPIYPLFSTLLYYDARIRKEGYDIELMEQQVGGATAGATKPQPA